jgi:hydrogenase maturation protease
VIAGSAELRDRAGTAALAPDPPAAARVVVLGIGNTLLTDEALGIQAVERFAAMYRVPDHVQLIDGGTSAMELLDVVADCELLIVVDALLANSTPGSVVRLAADAVPVFFRTKLSPHQVGLSDLLASLEFAGQSPRTTVILGIEPADMRLGLELTPIVEAHMPELVGMIAAELRGAGIDLAAGSTRM